ncbi:potassium voltage-gated channel protein Shaw-like [Gigantopelta aegis]|uniref:potassium voltage-gated channel protein Shaw-like n=1 Tax=Gigantopelta aegis TaxID=1735272 RepID=UPI001B8876F1|nr:potassium voltage-gated channel protein Shaw-like [Gigantopelta aegis]
MVMFEQFTAPKKTIKEGTGPWSDFKYRVWRITDWPFSSVAAKVYFVIASLLVVTSTFLVIVATHPLFKHALTRDEWRQYWADDWDLHSDEVEKYLKIGADRDNSTDNNFTLGEEELETLKRLSATHYSIRYTGYFCTAFFTTELCVRLIVCPSIHAFFKSFLNIVDALAVIVAIVELVANVIVSTELFETTYVDVLSCFQILRVLRLYRLTSHITGARVLSYAVRISVNELVFMALLLTINTVIFGTVAYYADQSNMKNILRACWWAVITMTTVGYGDIVPSTAVGKLVGVLCAAMGIMVIAITVPLFVNNFLTYYVYADLQPDPASKVNAKQSKRRTGSMTRSKVHQCTPERGSDTPITIVTEC